MQTYKPKITDAIKLNISPVFEKIDYKKDTINYKTDPKPLHIDLKSTAKIGTVSLIKPKAKAAGDELQRLFIKAGVGNYSNIFAQVDYNTIKMDNSSFAVHLQHQSGNAAPDNSNFGEQNVYVAGRKYFKNTLLSGKIFLNNDKIHFYGYDTSIKELKNFTSTQNKFLDVGLNAHLNNEIDTSSKLKYWLDLKYANFSDAYKVTESGFYLGCTVEQKINNYPIRFNLSYLSNKYKINNVENPKNYILHVGANYLITKSNWRTEIGFLIDYDTAIHFYPNVYAQAKLYSNSLIVFAGITGNLISNSFKSLEMENPYIIESPQIKNTNNSFEIYGGLKGNFSKDMNYVVKVTYQNLENMVMFVNNTKAINNDSANLNRFTIIYSKPTFLLKLHAELNKFITDELEVFLGFNYYKYTLDSVWHKPGYDLILSAKYKLEKKIYVNFDLLGMGERKTLNVLKPSEPYILKPIYDANIGITYQFNKMFGIYFQFNNILSTKYSYWYNYELRGFQVVGGLKVNL